MKVYTALTPEEVKRRLGDKVSQEDAELYASLSGTEISNTIRYVEITLALLQMFDSQNASALT